MNTPRSRHHHLALPTMALATSVALLLAGCGSSGSGASTGGTDGTQPSAAPTNAQQGGGTGGQRQPGVSGLIADISGKTVQVQSATEQTAVTYTASTRFTATVAASKKDVTVGSCVVAAEARTDAGTPSGTPTARPTQATSIAAATVVISAPANGQCGFGGLGGGFGGGGGGFAGGAGGPGGTPTGIPSGAPTGGANGGFAGRGGFGGFAQSAIGKVTAVTSTGFTVSAVSFAGRPGGGTGAPTSTPTGTPSLSTRTVTVTTSGATKYTTTKSATASALAVGKCLTARGPADSSGTVTATAIAVTPATNGSCTQRGA